MSRILVTGASSGLGKYLSEQLDAEKHSFVRNGYFVPDGTYDLIIHCGWNTSCPNMNFDYVQQAHDQIINLGNVNFNHIVFISTIDVYPLNHSTNENDKIDKRDICGMYGITKFLAEELICKFHRDITIIRPSLLLGKYSRHNNLIAAINNQSLNISEESVFNICPYELILEIIRSRKTGIFNAVSSDNIQLKEYCTKQYTDLYKYDCGNLCSKKLKQFFSPLVKTSKENIKTWQKTL